MENEMQKSKEKSKSPLWSVLAIINVVCIAVPLNYFLRAVDDGTKIFAAVVLVCAGLFLLILDGLTALLANFNVNEL